jgi:hypothetical protein
VVKMTMKGRREFERATEKAAGQVCRVVGNQEPYLIIIGDEVGVIVPDRALPKVNADA